MQDSNAPTNQLVPPIRIEKKKWKSATETQQMLFMEYRATVNKK